MSSTTAGTASRATGRVTAKDVARHASVSQSTVSYVLNNTPGQSITPATRERVLQAVRELGYVPSAAARTLRTGVGEGVLLILPHAPLGHTIVQFIDQVTDELDRYGFSVVFRRRKMGQDLTRLIQEMSPAAVVFLGTDEAPELTWLTEKGTPAFFTGIDSDQPGVIDIPQHSIGALQAQHLIERGHRRIGYALDRNPLLAPFATARHAGAREACLQAGLPEPVVMEIAPDIQDAAGAVARWRAAAEPVTAVCAHNDDTAFTLLAGMRELGLSAPQDLAVIGVDNTPLGAFAAPPLTTIDSHIERFGVDMVRVVLAELAPGKAAAPSFDPRAELIVRGTT